ncbi:DeoR faimly transcriptional regulator [Amycolatopsis sp. MJM2582]|uniref:alpha/beta hydrolase n=1 Tax=Amycolatopsis TaxID=1813 RepID=UPI0005086DA8|nr:alpha/beta hydrolase [Amycolatopsis sp. MJM2582]KFZ77034.1 DeoR faimly transcriptional regulator [Amycolatopsis sp. MJM2582]
MKTNVTFPSAGLALAGLLFTPDDHTGAPLPAVVVSHPGGGVKEQTASIYAERLAREGYATLVFDAAYQGDSEGLPRGLENPFQRAEDVRAAVTYLTTRDDIDPARIGALGICASGGYVPFAAQTDHRIKAVATVSAVDIRSLLVEGLGRTQGPEVLQAMLDQAGALRTAEARGEAPALQNWAPESPEGLEEAPTLYREAQDYYRTPRGGHTNSTNEWPLRSIDQIAQYDSYAMIKLIAPRPLLMIIGSDADTGYFSREAIEKADEPKELFVIDGATHVALYDQDEHVTPAVTKLTGFFGEHLTA